MDDKLLDKLLEMVAQRRPSWSRISAELRIANVREVRGVKPSHMSSQELKLRIEMLDLDRQIANLQVEARKKAAAEKEAKAKAVEAKAKAAKAKAAKAKAKKKVEAE